MKQFFLFLISMTFLVACKKVENSISPAVSDPTAIERTISGAWTLANGGAGGNNFSEMESPKNFQYTFEVLKSNQVVNIALTSTTIDVNYVLFDPLGQRLDFSFASRSASNHYTLNAGKYRLVIVAARRAVGDFKLKITGVNADPEAIIFQKSQAINQSWGPLGGGGFINYAYKYNKTLKNPIYTFDITEDNAIIDVELESPDVNVALVLYDELGQIVGYAPRDARYVYQIVATRKGTYTAVLCTMDRGAMGNFNFRVFGKISNVQRLPSQYATLKGAWSASSKKDNFGYAYDSYTVEVTGNATPLDLELFSSDAYVELYLETSSGVAIDYHVQSFLTNKIATFISPELPKGTYRIIAHSSRGGYGNYTLNIFGQFANLKKE